jgi:hypothetical protein
LYFPQKAAGMSPYGRIAVLSKDEKPPPLKRKSGAVAVIALYQVLKAGFFLYLFQLILSNHEAKAALGADSQTPMSSDPYLALLPLVSLVLLLIGWGIWRLRNWARLSPGLLLGMFVSFALWDPPATPAVSTFYTTPSFLIGLCIVELTTIGVLYSLPSVADDFARANRV